MHVLMRSRLTGIDGRGTRKLASIPMPYASHDTLGVQWMGFL